MQPLLQPPMQPPQPPLPFQTPSLKDEDDFYAPEEPHTPDHTSVRDLDPTPKVRTHVRCIACPEKLLRLWQEPTTKDKAWDRYYRHHPYSSGYGASRPSGIDDCSGGWEDSSEFELSYPRQPLGSPFREPSPLPQEGPSGLQPRKSGRERRHVTRPDNLYGDHDPTSTEQLGN
jgi:hypothetical protein